MRYITVKGTIHGEYIKSEGDVYWLDKDSKIFGERYALLEKTWQGSYVLLRTLKIEQRDVQSENIEERDMVKG